MKSTRHRTEISEVNSAGVLILNITKWLVIGICGLLLLIIVSTSKMYNMITITCLKNSKSFLISRQEKTEKQVSV